MMKPTTPRPASNGPTSKPSCDSATRIPRIMTAAPVTDRAVRSSSCDTLRLDACMAFRTTFRESRDRIRKTRRIRTKSTILKKIPGPVVVIQSTAFPVHVLMSPARTSPLSTPVVISPVTSKISCW